MAKPVIAAFDFDGTLTRGDSLLPFLRYLLGTGSLLQQALPLLPLLLRYQLHLIANDQAKEQILCRLLAPFTAEELAEQGRQFAHDGIRPLLRPKMVARLIWHQQQGHRTVLISASPDLYLQPWGEMQEFDTLLTTQIAYNAQRRMSGFATGNCYGAAKVERLLESLEQPREAYEIYAYGDSRGDRELLQLADHPYYQAFR